MSQSETENNLIERSLRTAFQGFRAAMIVGRENGVALMGLVTAEGCECVQGDEPLVRLLCGLVDHACCQQYDN